MIKSFADIDKDIEAAAEAAKPAEAAAPETSTAVAVAEPHAIVSDGFFSNNDVEGEFDRSDIKLPRLNLVQAVGPLSENFQAGQMLYNGEDVISSPVKLTVLAIKKGYIEILPYGSEVFPRRYDTAEAARADGLWPLREKKSAPDGVGFFGPIMEATVLVEGDPEKHVSWPFEYEGKPYALAVWTLKSIAYTATAVPIVTATQFALRNGLANGVWTVTPKREKFGTNFVWIPRIKMSGRNTPEFIEFIKQVTGA